VGFVLGLLLTMCMLLPVAQFTKAIVEEKELRLKQTMRMMGLRDATLAASWCILGLFDALLIATALSFTTHAFLVHTPFVVLYVYLSLFCLGAFALALLLSTCFSHAKLAAVVAPIVFFALLLPKCVSQRASPVWHVRACSLRCLLRPTLRCSRCAHNERALAALLRSRRGAHGVSGMPSTAPTSMSAAAPRY
jgi:hypothetical protein